MEQSDDELSGQQPMVKESKAFIDSYHESCTHFSHAHTLLVYFIRGLFRSVHGHGSVSNLARHLAAYRRKLMVVCKETQPGTGK